MRKNGYTGLDSLAGPIMPIIATWLAVGLLVDRWRIGCPTRSDAEGVGKRAVRPRRAPSRINRRRRPSGIVWRVLVKQYHCPAGQFAVCQAVHSLANLIKGDSGDVCCGEFTGGLSDTGWWYRNLVLGVVKNSIVDNADRHKVAMSPPHCHVEIEV